MPCSGFSHSGGTLRETKRKKKIDNYLDLDRELKKLWNMKETMMIIRVGALGTVPKGFKRGQEELENRGRIETIQTTVWLKSARILSRLGRRLLLCRGARLPQQVAQSAGAVEYSDWTFVEGYDSPNECPGYYSNQSDDKVPVMLELWRIRSTLSLSSLPGPLWPGVVAPDRVLSMDQTELTVYLC